MAVWDSIDRAGRAFGGPFWDALRVAAFHRRNTLYLCLRRACNLRCAFCYTPREEVRSGLSLQERRELIRQGAALGLRQLTVVGEGEPLLDPQLFPLLEEARAAGMALKIFTNGTLIGPREARALAALDVLVVVKILSLRPEVLHRVAGPVDAYHFQRHLLPHGRTGWLDRGVQTLLATLPAERLVVETLLLKDNLWEVPTLAGLCQEWGLGFFPETLISCGGTEELLPHPEELAALYGCLRAILGPPFVREQRLGACFVAPNPIVGAQGQVLTCLVSPRRMGHLRERTLEEILAAAPWPPPQLLPPGPGGFRSCPARSRWREL